MYLHCMSIQDMAISLPGMDPFLIKFASLTARTQHLLFWSRFKRGTSQYLGADDEDESELIDRPSPGSSPDKAQVSEECQLFRWCTHLAAYLTGQDC